MNRLALEPALRLGPPKGRMHDAITRLLAEAGIAASSGDRVYRPREAIDRLALLLDARARVMIEVNVPGDRLDAIAAAVPCVREPTIAPLRGGDGYAVKAAVPRCELPDLIPCLKARGGSDIVVSPIAQVVA